MPYSIYIDSNTLDSAAWEKAVLAQLSSHQPAELLPVSTMDRILPQSYLLTDGGIRGISVKMQEDGQFIEVSIPSPAGSQDWVLARALVQEARRMGAAVSDDGDLATSGFSDEAWNKADLKNWAVFSLIKTKGGANLPGLFALKVDVDLAALPRQAVEEALAGRARRYGRAFRASAMVMSDDTVMGSYALIDTFIDKRVTHVVYNPRGEMQGGVQIPIDDMRAALGDACEDHGQWWFFPEMDITTEHGAQKLAELNQRIGVDLSHLPVGEPQMTERDFRAIQLTPYFTFLLVAAADGEIDPKEIQSFEAQLQHAREAPWNPLINRLLPVNQSESQELLQQALEIWKDVGPMSIAMTAKIGRTWFGEAWDPVVEWLIELGTKIAEASGGGMFRSKIDADEKKALAFLAATLRAPLE